ncbi:MAG: hypothetical protein IKO41_15260 [Lachnospiraceae bacterium]|nr:hypothetical protein [Lachnospiraceae bacterium]
MPNTNQHSSADKEPSSRDEAISKDIKHFASARIELVTEIFSRTLEETITIGNPKNVAVYSWIKTHDHQPSSATEITEACYKTLLSRVPDRNLVKIYVDDFNTRPIADRGIAFLQMLDDCKSGSIDLILTKRMSLFDPDPILCVNLINELLALPHPVGVFFERERINTLDPKSVNLLNMLSIHVTETRNRDIHDQVTTSQNRKT